MSSTIFKLALLAFTILGLSYSFPLDSEYAEDYELLYQANIRSSGDQMSEDFEWLSQQLLNRSSGHQETIDSHNVSTHLKSIFRIRPKSIIYILFSFQILNIILQI